MALLGAAVATQVPASPAPLQQASPAGRAAIAACEPAAPRASPAPGAGDDALLPRHTVVRVVGNNRTKQAYVGQQAVVVKSLGLGGWHFLTLASGEQVKLQRNALAVVSLPTGDEPDPPTSDDDDGGREPPQLQPRPQPSANGYARPSGGGGAARRAPAAAGLFAGAADEHLGTRSWDAARAKRARWDGADGDPASPPAPPAAASPRGGDGGRSPPASRGGGRATPRGSGSAGGGAAGAGRCRLDLGRLGTRALRRYGSLHRLADPGPGAPRAALEAAVARHLGAAAVADEAALLAGFLVAARGRALGPDAAACLAASRGR